MTKSLKLPAPDARYAFYTLADGSRIYPSGVRYDDKTRACKWFVWLCRGLREEEVWDEKGKRRSIRQVRDGEVWMDREGVCYFDTPQEALQALQEVLK